MINERQAGAANFGVQLPANAFSCLGDQPTGLQIQTILALQGITIAIGDTPVIVEIVAAVSNFGIDDLVHEEVKQFVKSYLDLLIAGDVVECGQSLYEAEVPIVG